MVQHGRPSVVNAVTFWPTYACTIPFGESTASARASEKKKKRDTTGGGSGSEKRVITLSHFLTVGESVCKFPKVWQSARKSEEVCVNLEFP